MIERLSEAFEQEPSVLETAVTGAMPLLRAIHDGELVIDYALPNGNDTRPVLSPYYMVTGETCKTSYFQVDAINGGQPVKGVLIYDVGLGGEVKASFTNRDKQDETDNTDFVAGLLDRMSAQFDIQPESEQPEAHTPHFSRLRSLIGRTAFGRAS